MLGKAEAFIFGRCRDAVSNVSTNRVNDFLPRQLPSSDLSTSNAQSDFSNEWCRRLRPIYGFGVIDRTDRRSKCRNSDAVATTHRDL